MKSAIFDFIEKYYLFLLGALLVISLLSRIWRLDTPSGYMFDEVYHAVTAKLMARNDPRAYEWWHAPVEPNTAIEWTHPPLGKLFHAIGIVFFGENEFGWRISSVLVGVATIYLVARVADELFNQKTISLLSATLFSLEGLTITQSRIAMNDIFLIFFILFTLFWYVRYKKTQQTKSEWKKYLIFSGIGIGLTIATKWSGILIIGLLVADQIFEFFKHKKFSLKSIAIFTFAWALVPISIYMLSYSQMFIQGKGYAHFKELTQQMWWYHSGLEATHPYQSVPLQWVLNLRPVWFYVNYEIPNKIANVYAISNSMLVWSALVCIIGLIIKSLFFSDLITIQEKKDRLLLTLSLRNYSDPIRLLLMGYFIFWVPYLLSPRIMFFYHYLPAIPFLCIILAYCLVYLWKSYEIGRYIVSLVLLLIFANFIIFYPHWTALPVHKEFQTTWYQMFESWK